jgi:hypothetical protein
MTDGTERIARNLVYRLRSSPGPESRSDPGLKYQVLRVPDRGDLERASRVLIGRDSGILVSSGLKWSPSRVQKPLVLFRTGREKRVPRPESGFAAYPSGNLWFGALYFFDSKIFTNPSRKLCEV